MSTTIPGYTYGTPGVSQSPVTLSDLDLLKKTLLLGVDDVKCLRMSYDILNDQPDAILDVWYGFVASNPHLVYFFGNKSTGEPDRQYLAAVRRRFGQWILDTARAEYDQKWLDYQHEIGVRHHRTGKNKTEGVSSVDHINFRYLTTLIYR